MTKPTTAHDPADIDVAIRLMALLCATAALYRAGEVPASKGMERVVALLEDTYPGILDEAEATAAEFGWIPQED